MLIVIVMMPAWRINFFISSYSQSVTYKIVRTRSHPDLFLLKEMVDVLLPYDCDY